MPSKFILIITSFLIFAFLGLFSFFYVFTLKNILIHADYPCVADDELIAQIKSNGQSIFLIKEDQISGQLKQKFSCIDKVELKTNLPSTLEIFYSGKNLVAKIDSTDLYFTAAGLAIKSNPTEALPVIFLPQGVQVSENAKITNTEVLTALKIVNSLSRSDFILTNVRIVGDTVTVYNQEDSVVIFSANKEAEYQADSLQIVLAKARMESKKISKIDMRFNNPIIVFK